MYFDISNRYGMGHECDGRKDGQTYRMIFSNSVL